MDKWLDIILWSVGWGMLLAFFYFLLDFNLL
jgi:hypothetical protein